MSTREKLSVLFFFAILIFLLYGGCLLLEPFAGPLICAIVVGIVFYPMHAKLGSWRPRWNRTVLAILSDFIVFLFFVIPAGLMVLAVVEEADQVIPAARDGITHLVTWIKTNPLQNGSLASHIPDSIKHQLDTHATEVQNRLASIGNRSIQYAASLGTALAGHTFTAIIDTIIFLFALFFVFRDGSRFYERFTSLLPLESASKTKINNKLHMTLVGVVRGTFVTAFVQGVSSTIGFLIIRADAAFVLGFLTALATFIPSVGTALVWLPVSLFYFLTGATGKGIFVVAWGILIVGLADNFLRPYIVGNKAEMPFFWLFFALLGGIEVFGPLGVVLGPLIFGMIAVFLDLYEQQYLTRR